ncbi:hypothetical protein PoB_001692600 [Plakobranchus ocellatus]|uniref:Uncharacterized protein n=1 Tax=Plakobranchus ocellatus TaxID=259542 RepID=A0AAV3Z3G5_9GAST|nr:hypothetical protein PoB_001692600 [Plakobranchus ocellatus]
MLLVMGMSFEDNSNEDDKTRQQTLVTQYHGQVNLSSQHSEAHREDFQVVPVVWYLSTATAASFGDPSVAGLSPATGVLAWRRV